MKSANRTNFLGLLVLLSVLYGCGGNNEKKPGGGGEGGYKQSHDKNHIYVRKNAHSPEASGDMDALQKAMAAMRKLPCDSAISWYYQGGIHWVPDTVLNHNPLCASYQSNKDSKKAWMNCTHAPGSAIHFLLWHRLYIYHFEKIVRKLSGKHDFALPYWDYTDSTYRTLPALYTQQASSLYEAGRFDSLNKGARIGPDMNSSLDVAKLFQNTIYSLFNSQINVAPHGAMHVYIGCGLYDDSIPNQIYQTKTQGGVMGNVPSAAFDPIFWLHHSNIDFLWQKWEHSGKGRRPVMDSLKAAPWPYVFFDENGKAVTYTIEQAYEKAFHPDYVYDVYKEQKAIEAEQVQLQQPVKPENIGQTTVNKKVKGNMNFTTKLTMNKQFNKEKLLGAQGGRLVLKVTVSFVKEPKSIYELYVKTKRDNAAINSPAKLAGTLNFFGAAHHNSEGHHDHGGENKKQAPEMTFTFDVTDELDMNSFDGNLDFSIMKKGKATDEITIKNVVLENHATE